MNLKLELYRGESRTITLTVSDPAGAPVNLSSGTWQISAAEWQMKAAVGAVDPPILTKSLGSGITLKAQSGTTLGQLDIALVPTDTAAVTPGTYSHDFVATFANGSRLYLIRPSGATVLDVVNQL